jgi:hypothetical protein
MAGVAYGRCHDKWPEDGGGSIACSDPCKWHMSWQGAAGIGRDRHGGEMAGNGVVGNGREQCGRRWHAAGGHTGRDRMMGESKQRGGKVSRDHF